MDLPPLYLRQQVHCTHGKVHQEAATVQTFPDCLKDKWLNWTLIVSYMQCYMCSPVIGW